MSSFGMNLQDDIMDLSFCQNLCLDVKITACISGMVVLVTELKGANNRR